MNFLAHLYLSGSSPEILTGNFIGDYVKGSAYEQYPEEIKYGILLHRKIDSFTDAHPVFKRTKNHFISRYHKYAGVVVDIIYDHFLANEWEKYSFVPLAGFINDVYDVLLSRFDQLPARVQGFLPCFVVYNWLSCYNSLDGLEKVIRRMTVKTSLPDQTDFMMEVIRKKYDQISHEFNLFFPDLIEHVEEDNVVQITIPKKAS
jgi:acyl carrier protein phosphodiesterase